jgi:hypothetical protein
VTLFLLIFNLIHDKTYFYLHYVHDEDLFNNAKEKKSENFVKEQEYLSAKNFFLKKPNENKKQKTFFINFSLNIENLVEKSFREDHNQFIPCLHKIFIRFSQLFVEMI